MEKGEDSEQKSILPILEYLTLKDEQKVKDARIALDVLSDFFEGYRSDKSAELDEHLKYFNEDIGQILEFNSNADFLMKSKPGYLEGIIKMEILKTDFVNRILKRKTLRQKSREDIEKIIENRQLNEDFAHKYEKYYDEVSGFLKTKGQSIAHPDYKSIEDLMNKFGEISELYNRIARIWKNTEDAYLKAYKIIYGEDFK